MSTQAANDLLARVWADLQRSTAEHAERGAKLAPEKYKLSRYVARGGTTGYTYWTAGKNRKGQLVWHCAATSPNIAGFYLYWKQVRMRNATKRIQFVAFKTEGRAQTEAKRRAAKDKERYKR